MASRVEGLERLKRRFTRLPIQMKADVRPALDKGADELVEMQKRLVPVDEGDLRDSIHKRDGRHDLSVTVAAGAGDAFHATFVEYGTSKMRARAFFWPSYRTLRTRIKRRIGRAVGQAVRNSRQ